MAKKSVATEDEPPALAQGNKWTWTKSHVWVHRPFYLWLPLGVVAVIAGLHGYSFLTGRQPLDDAPIGALWNVLLALVAVILTNSTKPRLFDDVDTTKESRWWRVAIDSLETAFLLVFFGWLLLH